MPSTAVFPPPDLDASPPLPAPALRALRRAPGEPERAERWQAFLWEVVRDTPMTDFAHYGEPYPALNGVVLSPTQHRQLVSLTEAFARIFEKASAALARDTAALARLGFPWVAVEPLAMESLTAPLVLGRFDFLLDRDGQWQLLEYNADTPSGLRETVVVEAAIARHLGLPAATAGRSGPRLVATVRRAVLAALAGLAAADGGHPAVLGIMTDAGYAEDLAQAVFMARTLAPALSARGIDVVYGDVDNLYLSRGRLCLVGRPLAALYRYYPFETLLGQQAFVDILEATAAGRLRLLNGLRGLLAQNKGLLAWIWQHRDDRSLFDGDERRVIRDHLPPACWIQDMPPDAGESTPGDLVLKQVFGREGEEVYFGDRLGPADWAQCRAWGSYVVQRRVRAEPIDAVVHTSDGPEVRRLWPVVGSFAAGGRWAGYYTRAGDEITTGHAKFVGTFWQRDP